MALQDWFGFYALTGGVAATLLGLLFVAVSINAARILGPGHDSTRRMAEQAFQNYSTVIVTSLLALIPKFTLAHFALVVLCVSGASAVWVVVRFYLTLTGSEDGLRKYSLRRHAPSILGFGLLIYSAINMGVMGGDSRNLLASAIIVLLTSATVVSWELLVRMSEARQSAH
jgi:hypothetical protein